MRGRVQAKKKGDCDARAPALPSATRPHPPRRAVKGRAAVPGRVAGGWARAAERRGLSFFFSLASAPRLDAEKKKKQRVRRFSPRPWPRRRHRRAQKPWPLRREAAGGGGKGRNKRAAASFPVH